MCGFKILRTDQLKGEFRTAGPLQQQSITKQELVDAARHYIYLYAARDGHRHVTRAQFI